MNQGIPMRIPVTQPCLPPLEEFLPYLEEIWSSKMLTNGGPMHQRLEPAMCEHLGVEHLALFNNGTIALMVALRALGISGEVITTPYSFVATAHSLLWCGVTPVFVDVDPMTLNINPGKVEAAITSRTTAIMAVHCYGNPCDVDSIRKIAEAHHLKVIYDAAHAFGVKDGGGSILRHGDLSVLSFHATKVFNTFEGGAIVCHDKATKSQIDRLKNFGIIDEETVSEIGLNGKMSEVNAAFGLLQLDHVDEFIRMRGTIDRLYRDRLRHVEGISPLEPLLGTNPNYSYFPILVKEEYPIKRDDLQLKLREIGVYSRRYFYPLISEFPMYSEYPTSNPDILPVATAAARRVLCLPIYPGLSLQVVEEICDLIASE